MKKIAGSKVLVADYENDVFEGRTFISTLST